jgi:hypothetical protein
VRHESSITSVSWIPSQAIEGTMKLSFDMGFTHYDPPPPDSITDESLEQLRLDDGFRFANVLKGWIEVDDATGQITGHGMSGGRLMGATTVKLGPMARTFEAVGLPDIRKQPEVGDGWVRFVQTCGGRTGVPAPRRVRRAPFIQWNAPLVWTTLSLTIQADGTANGEVIGHSRFPRHWVYGADGNLCLKSGLADFKEWWRVSFGPHTPWGDRDSEALVTTVETALERQLSAQLMSGKPEFRRLKAGETLVRQGDAGKDVFLILDGFLRVEKDGKRLAEYGPGAMLGERAHLEAGGRTSSLIAVTPCRIATVHAEQLDRSALEQLASGHRREDEPQLV